MAEHLARASYSGVRTIPNGVGAMAEQYKFLTTSDLDDLYDPPFPPVIKSVKEYLTDFHIRYLERATFFCLATESDDGVDCSPRGGDAGLVHVIDSTTVCFADWPGNNKIASLRHITRNGRVAMLFIFPGLDVFMRINGQAGVTVDAPVLDLLSEGSRRPKTAIVVRVDRVFFHCGKAIKRADLWNADRHIDRKSVPSPGVMMKKLAELEDVDPKDLDEKYETSLRDDLYSDSDH